MKKVFLGYAFIALSSVFAGIISLFSIPLGNAGITPVQTTFIRSFFSAATFAVLVLIKSPRGFKVKLKDLPVFFGSGVLGFFLINVCYISSIEINGSAVGAMLMYTSPVFVTIFARVFFKEKISLIKLILLVTTLGGCAMVTLGGAITLSFLGVLLGLGSGVALALYGVFSKMAVSRGYSSETSAFYTMAFSTLASVFFANPVAVFSAIGSNGNIALLALHSALLSTAIPYFFYPAGLKYISAVTAGIISIIEPVVAALVGVFVFRNNLGALGICGMIVVIGSLVLMTAFDSRKLSDFENAADSSKKETTVYPVTEPEIKDSEFTANTTRKE